MISSLSCQNPITNLNQLPDPVNSWLVKPAPCTRHDFSVSKRRVDRVQRVKLVDSCQTRLKRVRHCVGHVSVSDTDTPLIWTCPCFRAYMVTPFLEFLQQRAYICDLLIFGFPLYFVVLILFCRKTWYNFWLVFSIHINNDICWSVTLQIISGNFLYNYQLWWYILAW